MRPPPLRRDAELPATIFVTADDATPFISFSLAFASRHTPPALIMREAYAGREASLCG